MKFDIETTYGGSTFHPAYFVPAVPAVNDSISKCCAAMRRQIQLVEQLQDGEKLGWQLSPGQTDRLKLFAGEHAPVSAADYGWIYQDLGKVEATESPESPHMSGDSGTAAPEPEEAHSFEKVYVLRKKLPAVQQDYDEPDFAACVQLLETLIASGTCVKVTFLRSSGEIYGQFILAMNGELPLRARAMAAEAFPALEIYELQNPWDGMPVLPEGAIVPTAGALLYAFLKYRSNVPLGGGNAPSGETAAHQKYDNMDIAELDLSVRAFNCLKRSGIHTVGQLLEYSPEQLVKVRNLGRRCIEEISNKLQLFDLRLAETPEHPVDEEEHPTEASQRPKKEQQPVQPEQKETSMQKLQKLIGLTEVKEQAKKIAAFARMKQAMVQRGMPGDSIVLNMGFTGNPGTAKTTVARILAGILHETGILKSPEILEVGRAQLVGKYVGYTAVQVKEIFEKASGRLLFIDEAYSLVEDNTGGYGAEAIDTIVQEMENRRSDTVVVFAGYPDKMEELFDSNPGLRSRVPFQINFPDYSAEEMLEIVRMETAKRGFESCPDAERKVLDICRETAKHPDSGNGRFCRNLVDAAMLNYAERVFGGDQPQTPEHFILDAVDFEMPDILPKRIQRAQPRHLGFCA